MSRALTLVAILSSSVVAHAHGEEAAADDAALAEVQAGIEAEEQADEGPSLRFYGFADFRYSMVLMPHDAAIFAYTHEHNSFAVGNLNLYADGRLSSEWRSLIEIRFTYLPAGAETLEGTTWERTSTSVLDDGDYNRPVRWGGIVIERAYLEWAPHSLFAIRAGQFISPYGIWNEDHGSPTIIPVHRPYVVGEELMPRTQTGLRLSGEWAFAEETSLRYDLTLSNGRGPVDFYRDLDEDKAIGARLELVRFGPGELHVGVAAYRGRFTDERNGIAISDGLAPTRDVVEQYDEWAFAADVMFHWGPLHLQAEAMINDRAYTDRGRLVLVDLETGQVGLTPDLRRFGVYVLAGYRLPWLELMPYVVLEDYVFGLTAIEEVLAVTFGLNYHPVPSVALKAQFAYAVFPGAAEGSLGELSFRQLDVQAAWAF